MTKETSNAPSQANLPSLGSDKGTAAVPTEPREVFQQPPALCQAAPGQKPTRQDRALQKALMLEDGSELTSRSHSRQEMAPWETRCSEDREVKKIIMIACFSAV